MPSDAWLRIALLALLACVLVAIAWRSLRWLRVSPAEKERRRRDLVNRTGRTHEGFLTDVHESLLAYSYSVNGVDYSASQDIADLRPHVPENPKDLIGPINIKYLPRNPANSILLCEAWSGLRVTPQIRR